MQVYLWEGTTNAGKIVKGEIEAQNEQQVFNALKSKNITPNLKKIKLKNSGMGKELKIPGTGPKVKQADIVIFTRQFATMIDAGLPIVQGIDVVGSNHENPAMRKLLSDVKEFVESGGTFADALAKHPKNFDQLFINMVAAGEAGGILDIILERLAQYLEKAAKLKREIKTAMIYPAVVVSAAVIVTSILLIFVIPTFAELFGDFGAALPAPTRIVIAMSNFMLSYGIFLFMGLGLFLWGFLRFAKTERGKAILHPIALRLPIFGDLIKKVAVARFSRTLSTMLSSGVAVLDALLICGRTAGNKVVEKEIGDVRISISEGKTMVEPLQGSKVFSPMVIQMINVGESTGTLDAMLSKIADFYEDEVENAVGGMKQLIEPLMILMLGTLIGGLVIAMYLPIFKLGSVVG